MSTSKVTVTIKLIGWFPDIYEANKPKGMSDQDYLNAIVSDWLMVRDAKNPIDKVAS